MSPPLNWHMLLTMKEVSVNYSMFNKLRNYQKVIYCERFACEPKAMHIANSSISRRKSNYVKRK